MSQNTAETPRGAGPGMGSGTGTGHGAHVSGRNTGAWAAGGTLFAGTLMLVAGVMDVLQGIVAVARDNVFSFTSAGGYVYSFNIISWGWIHLALGTVLALAGLGVLRNATWARMLGIGLAALNVIAQFMFLPYSPVWSIMALAVSVFVIWALAWDRQPHRAPR
jgi:hypothetical protein